MRSASGSVARTISACCRAARSIAAFFRVRGRYGRKVAVRDILFFYRDDVRKAEFAERFGDEDDSGSVYRRVDDFQVVMGGDGFGRQRQRMNGVEVDRVEGFVENDDVVFVSVGEHLIRRRDLLHLRDDVFVVRSHYLSAVVPVRFVAVILFRVVRGGDDHAAVAFQLADGEAQLGRRTERVEQVNLESVRCEDVGDAFRKQPAVVAAVVPDSDLDLLTRKGFFQVVRKALRSHADRVDVHPVGAYPHDAAQAARAEFEVFVEALGQLAQVVIHKIFDLLFRVFVVVSGEPFFGSLLND